MKIAFHSGQLGLRGTEIALYDYAYYARKFLNVEPYIISNQFSDLDALEKFKSEFEVYLYKDFSEVSKVVDTHHIDAVYYIKAGNFDGKIVPNAKNLIHAVFQMHQPHGDKYAYVSEWIAKKMNWEHYVPHIVDIQRYAHPHNLREQLNISTTDMVLGYHGGKDSFNISWVKDAVLQVAKIRSDIHFVFMNVTPFGEETSNISFMEGTYDMNAKVAFINTCDAMLHARDGGESFGLSVAEFSRLNKPILTTEWASGGLIDMAHLYMLGDKAIIYSPDTVSSILLNIQKSDFSGKTWDAYADYSPENVMSKFKQTFL